MKRTLTLAVIALLLTIGLSPAAHASTLGFSLDDPIQAANPGDTVYFWATLSQFIRFGVTGTPIFLNGDTFTLDSPLSLDDSGLFVGFPPTIVPNDEDDNVLFTVTLPFDIPTGTYIGSFTIFGGDDENANDELGYQNFSVSTVNTPTVPEPSSLLLLGTGLVGAVAAFKGKKIAQVA